MAQSHGFRRYLGNTSWMMLSRVFRLAAALGVGILTARYLGKEQFGRLSYAVSLVTLFSALAGLGLDDIVVREIVADEGGETAGEILGTCAVLRLLGCALMTALVLGAGRILGAGPQLMLMLGIVCLSFLLLSVARLFEKHFEARVNARYSSWAQIVAVSASAGLSLVLIWRNASLVPFAWVRAGEAFVLLVGLVVFHLLTGPRVPWRPSGNRARGLLRQGAPLMLTGIFFLVYMRIDQVMIKHFLGDGAVGCYAVAVGLSRAWYFVPTVIVSSFFPAVLQARARDPAQYKLRLQQLYESMTWLGIGVALPVSLLAGRVIRLVYGTQYAAAGPVLALYVWAGVFVFQGIARGKWIVAEELQRYAIFFSAGACIINVVLNAVLIPAIGINGAALATVLSCACQTLLLPAFFSPTRPSVFAMLRAFIPRELSAAIRGRRISKDPG